MENAVRPRYAAIIPVYNSEDIVKETVETTCAFFEENNFTYEVILVNDGSPDNSWSVIEQLAKVKPEVKAIDLLKNYGQHSAVLCGIANASADYMITLDDDMQNPPAEMIHLIKKIEEGYDAVFAKFRSKKHAAYRRLGTKIIDYLNMKVFRKPKKLILSNFRIFTREVAQRMVAYKTGYPYIPGLVLLCSGKMANVETDHHPRKVGASNYSIFKILSLVGRLLFNYSSYPLKLLTSLGFLISALSMVSAVGYLIKALIGETTSPGFPTLVILLSFFCGFIIIMLGVIGEYLSRIMSQLSSNSSYQIREVVE